MDRLVRPEDSGQLLVLYFKSTDSPQKGVRRWIRCRGTDLRCNKFILATLYTAPLTAPGELIETPQALK